jgi:hypothetical protein
VCEETADDLSMPITARPQQRYDHRLRPSCPAHRGRDRRPDLGVPRSTARGWLGAAPTVVVCLDVADLTEPELRQDTEARRGPDHARRGSGPRVRPVASV